MILSTSYKYRLNTGIYLGLLLGLALLSGGCQTRQAIHFKVLAPATVSIPSNIYKVCVINNAIANNSDSNGVFYAFAGKLYYDSVKYDTLLSWSAIDAMTAAMSESARFELASDPYLLPRQPQQQFSLPLGLMVLDTLCSPAGAQGAIVLEDIRAFDMFDYYGFDHGLYYMKMKVVGAADFRFYDLKQQVVVDRYTVSDTLFWDNVAYGWDRCLQAFPARDEAFARIASQLGNKYISRISPTLRNEQRFYFVLSNNSDFKKGAEYAQQGMWATAARYWIKPASGKRKLQAALASFNMALASEMQGKLDIALYWIEQSLLHKQTPEAQKYRETLFKRQAEVDKLVEQLKIEP
ncbi:MAG: DUF6340 family protein [Bacteroidota bacterium]